MGQATSTLDLAVAMCACNNIRTIKRALDSVHHLARRVVVVDSGSTDGTIEHCRSIGAQVIERAWPGHVAQKQFAIDQCTDCQWTLLLDSDESLEPPLQDSVRLALQTNSSQYTGWLLNRKVFFLDGWLHHVFQPEWRLRLFRSGLGRVVGTDPHDRIEVDGATGRLQGDLRHDSWLDLRDMLERYIAYGRRSAQTGARGGSLRHILFNPPAAFTKQFLFKQGFRDGWRGLIASGGAAAGVMIKHLFIAHSRALRHCSPPTRSDD